ncbi:MAG: cellulase family glycosylhydrolase [Chitinivibrionales bacterium]|nr:cellulase family glycosylhydrolase [Chitinivibrionales bacterium]
MIRNMTIVQKIIVTGVVAGYCVLTFAQQTPVSINGRLQIIDGQLSNQCGNPVQLRGIGSGGIQWFGDCHNAESMEALAHEWKADIFRACVYTREGGYADRKQYMIDKTDNMVDWCEQLGMYCLVDWHVLTPGDPWEVIDDAKEFFEYMTQKHGQKEHVLFEICNEPNSVDWPRIKTYAEEIIPLIRKKAPDAIIIVGTPQWCHRPGDVLGNELKGDNIMYSYHFYASATGDYGRSELQEAIDGGLPMFVTEWGAMSNSGDGRLDLNSTREWISMLAKNKVSWCQWAYNDNSRSCGVFKSGTCPNGPWTGSSLKEHGILGMDIMQNPPDDFSCNAVSARSLSSHTSYTTSIGNNQAPYMFVSITGARVKANTATGLIGSNTNNHAPGVYFQITRDRQIVRRLHLPQ